MVMGNLACVTHGATMVYPSEGFDPEAVLQTLDRSRKLTKGRRRADPCSSPDARSPRLCSTTTLFALRRGDGLARFVLGVLIQQVFDKMHLGDPAAIAGHDRE